MRAIIYPSSSLTTLPLFWSLESLAFQVGSQVSYAEIAAIVGMDSKTVEKYIDLLEKAFVIYRLTTYSRNLRDELKTSKKVYFYDNGVRNALISAFNPLELRDDIGSLWENFMMAELLKKDLYTRNFAHRWFWRNKQQQEIDLIHEADGIYTAYEFKWNNRKKVSCPQAFTTTYPDIQFHTINRENFIEFLLEALPNCKASHKSILKVVAICDHLNTLSF